MKFDMNRITDVTGDLRPWERRGLLVPLVCFTARISQSQSEDCWFKVIAKIPFYHFKISFYEVLAVTLLLAEMLILILLKSWQLDMQLYLEARNLDALVKNNASLTCFRTRTVCSSSGCSPERAGRKAKGRKIEKRGAIRQLYAFFAKGP